jgi:hypothetical protein
MRQEKFPICTLVNMKYANLELVLNSKKKVLKVDTFLKLR